MGTQAAAPKAKQADVLETAQKVIALAFELPPGIIPRLPEQIRESLESDKVKQAIESALNEFMLVHMGKAATGQLSQKEIKALAEALGGAGTKAAQEVLIGKVKETPEFKQLLGAVTNFQSALNHSPLGVWVDHNKGLLIVTGIVLAVGGTAALFYTRAGGPYVEFPVSQIKGKAIELWSPGRFKLSGSVLEFDPGLRTLGVEVIGEQKWERLQLKINLGVIASEQGVKQVNGAAVAVVDKLTLRAEGMAQPLDRKYKLGLGFEYGKGSPGAINLSIHGIVTDGRLTGGDLSATYKPNPTLDLTLKGEKDQSAASVMLMARVKFW